MKSSCYRLHVGNWLYIRRRGGRARSRQSMLIGAPDSCQSQALVNDMDSCVVLDGHQLGHTDLQHCNSKCNKYNTATKDTLEPAFHLFDPLSRLTCSGGGPDTSPKGADLPELSVAFAHSLKQSSACDVTREVIPAQARGPQARAQPSTPSLERGWPACQGSDQPLTRWTPSSATPRASSSSSSTLRACWLAMPSTSRSALLLIPQSFLCIDPCCA